MKNYYCRLFAGCAVFIAFNLAVAGLSFADDETEKYVSTTVTSRYTTVKGDAERYRQQHWMKDGYTTGTNIEMYLNDKKGTSLSFDGAFIPKQNDDNVSLRYKKDNLGFMNVNYKMFRKYYDGTGGSYRPFPTLGVNQLNRDLHMDISNLAIELGPTPGEKSDISLLYERHANDGTKSRLSWTAVTENGLTREIGPVWQDMHESTDAIALKGKTDVAGVTVKGEQRFEFFHGYSLREEKFLSTTSGSGTKIRRQDQKPEADTYTSTFQGEKWLSDNKFFSLAYRYYKNNNSELENLNEFDETGTPHNYTAPKSAINATAENKYHIHTATGHFLSNLSQNLNFIAKFKAEVVGRQGSSIYPHDTTTVPDGIINTTDVSNIENKVNRTGENFSFRYNGIPKTSLYSELELEQTRNFLVEERNSLAGQSAADIASEQFARETLTGIQKTVWTLGGRIVPSSAFNMTMQVRQRLQDNDYDNHYKTNSSGTAKSAFTDGMRLNVDEADTRFTWKPLKWLQGAFRYQLLDTKYFPRAQNEEAQKARVLSNIFTYDLNMQPTTNWLLTMSFSNQGAKTSTPAASVATTTQPGFKSDVNSWLLSTSYTPKDTLAFTGSVQYSRARNFNNMGGYTLGLPLGADYDQYDFTTGMQWSLKKDLKIGPSYTYSHYNANPEFDVGNYNAHTIWLDLTYDWF